MRANGDEGAAQGFAQPEPPEIRMVGIVVIQINIMLLEFPSSAMQYKIGSIGVIKGIPDFISFGET